MLSSEGVTFAEIGQAGGKSIEFAIGKKKVVRLALKAAESGFYSLEKTMQR
jgi:hypothetical protein